MAYWWPGAVTPCSLAGPRRPWPPWPGPAQLGILVKGGRPLEEVARWMRLLFDKTGTLTLGEPVGGGDRAGARRGPRRAFGRRPPAPNTTSPIPWPGPSFLAAAIYGITSRNGPRSLSAEAGRWSGRGCACREIEVGRCMGIVADKPLPPSLDAAPVGRRVARGHAAGLALRERVPSWGYMAVTDRVRPSPGLRWRPCRDMGVAGCGHPVPGPPAGPYPPWPVPGASTVVAGPCPGDKPRIVGELQEDGRRVMFCGATLNDAPALARPTWAVAMGAAGTDVPWRAAQVALTRGRHEPASLLLGLSRRMRRVIQIKYRRGDSCPTPWPCWAVPTAF